MRKTVLLAVVGLTQLAVVFPAGAAEVIVPPGNSGAAQYTEAFPTAAGERDAEQHKQKRSPQKVLGKKESKHLQSKGSDGQAVAEIVAETSPAPDASADAGSAGPSSGSGGQATPPSGGNGEGEGKDQGGGVPAGKGNGGSGDSAGGTGEAKPRHVAEPEGSSGFGEVLGQATGASSSGKLGLFLPLILVGAVIWALLFAWRRRGTQRVA